jgi:hypothetical protein
METEAVGPHPRARGSIVVAVVFLLLAANALGQVGFRALGRSSDSLTLSVWQAMIGLVALAAAHGAWHRSNWGPAAAVLYGVVTGTMIALLGPMLDLPEEARRGLWMSGAIVLLIGISLGWYLRHLLRRPLRQESSTSLLE